MTPSSDTNSDATTLLMSTSFVRSCKRSHVHVSATVGAAVTGRARRLRPRPARDRTGAPLPIDPPAAQNHHRRALIRVTVPTWEFSTPTIYPSVHRSRRASSLSNVAANPASDSGPRNPSGTPTWWIVTSVLSPTTAKVIVAVISSI